MDIGKLFELQKLDVNLERARRKLAQLKQALGESEELGGARKTVAETEAELHRWHAAQTNAELESQALAEQIEAKDEELMSGRVSHPKELESLQANVESLRRQRSSIEDTGMDALLHVETLNQQLATAQESLARSKRRGTAAKRSCCRKMLSTSASTPNSSSSETRSRQALPLPTSSITKTCAYARQVLRFLPCKMASAAYAISWYLPALCRRCARARMRP